MITIKKNPKDVPVSTFFALSIIIIFLLFNAQVITSIPCGKNITDVFMSQFVHIDTLHLISNLYALYAMSRLEQEMGLKPFICLLIFLIIFISLSELLMRHIWKDLPCSIGFSGILFGLMTWELASKQKIDIEMIFAIIIITVGPSLKNKKISLSGHIIGAIAGITAGILWKYLNKLT